MIYVFHGKDSFLRKREVVELTAKLALPVVSFYPDAPPGTSDLEGNDLFGKASIFLLYGLTNTLLADDQKLAVYRKSKNHLVFIEDSLDKRLTFTKKLFADGEIIIRDCRTPEGKELFSWVEKRIKELEVSIFPKAKTMLFDRLGIAEAAPAFSAKDSAVSLGYIDNELRKLALYANGEEVSTDAVSALVISQGEVTGFEIINALADKNKEKFLSLLEQYYKSDSSDDKTKTIQLNSLLAQQFRNIAMVQDFVSCHLPDTKIVDLTGWKSGRLFVIKKIATRFTKQQVIDTLGKLESLDVELKSGTLPPQVLLDIILIPLF